MPTYPDRLACRLRAEADLAEATLATLGVDDPNGLSILLRKAADTIECQQSIIVAARRVADRRRDYLRRLRERLARAVACRRQLVQRITAPRDVDEGPVAPF